MKLINLNEYLLIEWWANDVSKSMKKNGTIGSFTQQCKDMGFNKASFACISHVEKEFEKIKKLFANGTINKKDCNEWALKKKRATLAKTFKKWGSNKKKKTNLKENNMKLKDLLLTEENDTKIDNEDYTLTNLEKLCFKCPLPDCKENSNKCLIRIAKKKGIEAALKTI